MKLIIPVKTKHFVGIIKFASMNSQKNGARVLNRAKQNLSFTKIKPTILQ